MSNALDTLAGLTSAALAVTDLMRAAQSMGREITDDELELVIAESMAKHRRAQQMVDIARQREEAAAGAAKPTP